MAKLDEKTKIIKLDESIDQPDGENRIIVEDDDSGALNDGWPKIVLTSDIDSTIGHPRGRLNSNGTDHCTIRAICTLPTGEPAAMLPRRDTATAYDERKIRTTYWMWGPPRVYVKAGEANGAEIPVVSWNQREIVTAVDMERVAHFIVYDGCDTVSFSVDQLAGIAPTEVPIVSGYAEAVLTARAEGGGYATVTGNFMGQEATLRITIADPGIESITARADPSSIDFITASQIIACVLAPGGFPVADGTLVSASIFSGPGRLSSATALTTTETIVEEEQWSPDEITVGVDKDITSVIGVYVDISGHGFNYYSGPKAEFDGKTITLGVGLPKKVTRVYVTYTAGGCAKFIFRSGAKGTAIIMCEAGQENCKVEVTVSAGSVSDKEPTEGSTSPDVNPPPPVYGPTYGEWQIWPRDGVWPDKENFNQDIVPDYKEELWIHDGPIEYQIIRADNCQISIHNTDGSYLLQVYGEYDIIQRPYWGADRYIRGNILLQGSKNGAITKIPGWRGQVTWAAWGDYAEDVETVEDFDSDALAGYAKGRPGSHSINVLLAPRFTVPQVKTFPLDGADVDETGGASYKQWKPVTWSVAVRWRAILG